MKKQVKDINKAIMLYNYFNNLNKNEKECNKSVTSNSIYYYFIKDSILYEVRISDHRWHIALKGGSGYTISRVSTVDPIKLGTIFLGTKGDNVGIVVASDSYLTTVRYSNNNNIVYTTAYATKSIINFWNETIEVKMLSKEKKSLFDKLYFYYWKRKRGTI